MSLVRVILFDWGSTLAFPGTRGVFLYDPDIETKLSVLFPDTLKTLTALHNAGYRLGIISNTTYPPLPMYDALAETGLQQLFSVVVLDSEAGHCSKPCTRIFLEACYRMGVSPEQCLFVGNNPDHDIKGAAAVGMHTALLTHEALGQKGTPPQDGGAQIVLPDLSSLLALFDP